MLVTKDRVQELEFLNRDLKSREVNVQDYSIALANARALGDRKLILKMRTLLMAEANLLWEAQAKLERFVEQSK